MVNDICVAKRKLDEAVSQLCEVSWMFVKNPGSDFTRNRKLPFRKMISFLLAMEGGSLSNEMLKHFGCSADIASSSAFVQQRNKINADAFPSLFDLFVRKTDKEKLYKGYRLLAADGSDIHIPTDPDDQASYFPGSDKQSAYNIVHLDAMYDLLQRTYLDVNLDGKRNENECSALCSMVDRSAFCNALLIADRGYESYNLFAHCQEKGWKFLIRIKDVASSKGIAHGFTLPDSDEFDFSLSVSLSTKQTNHTKSLFLQPNSFKFVPSSSRFDYLPKKNRKHEPAVFYDLSFRIVRFKLSDNSFETVITNLDSVDFPPSELKKLYNMRWGIETSFRALKYTVGLVHFHAKKVEYIFQEVYARLIMYNFSELVTSHVIIQKSDTKYAYKANFSVAVHICRQLFLGNVSPPVVEAIILRYVSPIRPGRTRPRNASFKHAVSFTYRIA